MSLRTELEAVLRPFGEAHTLPTACYVDPEHFARERRVILDRSWICVGREEEVALPGAFVLAPTDAAGIVVVRGHDLVLRAFRNVCAHRAMPLVEGSGRCEHLVCPYHGWKYDLDGRTRQEGRALREVAVSCHRGFVFVRIEGDRPYDERLPPWLAAAYLGQLSRVGRTTNEVAANWKLLVENFQESHHFGPVHRGLERWTPHTAATTWSGEGEWLGGRMPIVEGAETVSRSGRFGGRRLLVPAGADLRTVHDAMRLPTLLTSLQPDYLLTYRLYPRAVDRTIVVADTFFHPASTGDPDDVLAFWAQVNAEDRAVCEAQQRGMASGHAVPGPYASCEDGVHAFDARVARALLEEAP